MYERSIKAMYGITVSSAENQLIIVCTQTYPIIGMNAWKKAKVKAIRISFFFVILHSFNPFAKETENASIARPIPSAMLLIKNTLFIIIPFQFQLLLLDTFHDNSSI